LAKDPPHRPLQKQGEGPGIIFYMKRTLESLLAVPERSKDVRE